MQYIDSYPQEEDTTIHDLAQATAGRKGVLVRKRKMIGLPDARRYTCGFCNRLVDRKHYHFFRINSIQDRRL